LIIGEQIAAMSDEGDPEPAGRQSRRAAINSNSKTTDTGSKKEEFGKHRDMMKKLGPEDLRRIFRQYDEDGSGEISSEELVFVLTKLIGKLPSDDAVQAILEDIDADGSGSIDEDEFLEFFRQNGQFESASSRTEEEGQTVWIRQEVQSCLFRHDFLCLLFLLPDGHWC